MKIIQTLPLQTKSEMNQREHWRAKLKRKQHQQQVVQIMFGRYRNVLRPPFRVTFSRAYIGTPLDDDNLPTATKFVQDELAAILGVDDGDREKIKFTYEQHKWVNPDGEKVKSRDKHHVRVTIESNNE